MRRKPYVIGIHKAYWKVEVFNLPPSTSPGLGLAPHGVSYSGFYWGTGATIADGSERWYALSPRPDSPASEMVTLVGALEASFA